jgi:hypothetical protein
MAELRAAAAANAQSATNQATAFNKILAQFKYNDEMNAYVRG